MNSLHGLDMIMNQNIHDQFSVDWVGVVYSLVKEQYPHQPSLFLLANNESVFRVLWLHDTLFVCRIAPSSLTINGVAPKMLFFRYLTRPRGLLCFTLRREILLVRGLCL